MAFTPSSPVTGAVVTGLTSPTYTLTADTAPSSNGKQYAITGLGGTQTGVQTHSLSSPFVVSAFRPVTPKMLQAVNPATGQLQAIPKNVFKLIAVKGVVPLAGQSPVNAIIRAEIIVPAGADIADVASLKAMISCFGGLFWANASGIADMVVTNVI